MEEEDSRRMNEQQQLASNPKATPKPGVSRHLGHRRFNISTALTLVPTRGGPEAWRGGVWRPESGERSWELGFQWTDVDCVSA